VFDGTKEFAMSHVVEIKTEVRDEVAVRAACRRLGLPEPTRGTFCLFEKDVAGLGVVLPQWLYPAVIDLASGQVQFDHYNGRWGDPAQLGRFLQGYAIEKATLEARKLGHFVREQSLSDGSIKLVIGVGGVA
jgi:hypothetical protein